MDSGAGTDKRVVALVLVAGVVALLLAVVLGGRVAERHVAASNGVGSDEFVAVVGPGQVLCQTGEDVPGGTGFVRMTIGTYYRPGPPLRTSVEVRGRRIAGGRLAAGWRQGVVDVPLGAASEPAADAKVCVANRSGVRIAVAGAPLERRLRARVAGRPARGRVRMEYVEARRRSAWSRTSTATSRMAFARGLWGGVAAWAALALVVIAALATGRALLSTVAGTASATADGGDAGARAGVAGREPS